MNRRALWLAVAAAITLIALITMRSDVPSESTAPQSEAMAQYIRQALFAELQPVKLANCDFERFGESNDGGYLVCGNLFSGVKAGYSYGIDGYDEWGCDVARKFNVPVHQYDCFNLDEPSCPGAKTVFHAECVADSARVEKGRPFDTIENQMARNGDAANNVVLKIDVEGAEWDSFLHASDEVLQRIDQLVVEFHQVEEERYLTVVRKLKQHFNVAHLHFNNFSCRPRLKPFPAWAYEVLFVNKRLSVVDASGTAVRSHPLDAPNNSKKPDCQN